jgi:hypothetical protein
LETIVWQLEAAVAAGEEEPPCSMNIMAAVTITHGDVRKNAMSLGNWGLAGQALLSCKKNLQSLFGLFCPELFVSVEAAVRNQTTASML